MSARTTKSFALLLAFLAPSLSYAAVSINEVFYSPQSKSWIEIYNDTDNSIDLTKYKVLDSGAATNGHAVTAVGNNFLDPHQYAVIAKDPTTITTSAALFKSSLGAKTSGDTISLKDESGAILDTFTFTSSMGAAGDGNSLQKTSGGGWISAPPTAGSINATTAATPAVQDTQNTGSTTSQTTSSNSVMNTAQQNVSVSISTHYSYLPLSDFDASRDLQVSAGRPRLAAVGNPVEFNAEVNSDNGAVLYEWNFGDGVIESNKTVRHIYQYPGQYVVMLTASSPSSKAISRTTVKVVNPDMFVADASPEFVKVYNNSNDEVSLYGWELRSGMNTYMFPKDTIILPKQSVAFGKSITRLEPINTTNVVLAESAIPGAVSTIARVPTIKERELALGYKVLPAPAELSTVPRLAVYPVANSVPKVSQMAAPVMAVRNGASTSTATTTTQLKSVSPRKSSAFLTMVRHLFRLP